MAKAGRRAGTSSAETRQQLVDAAFAALREEGFAGASARAIATRAEVAPALVFYHFGSVNELLVEALAHSSRTQLARYEAALADATTPSDLVTSVRAQLRDDLASGHVKVLAELVGAGSADEDLRTAVTAQVQPWITFTEATLERVLGPTGLLSLVPARQVAFAVVSLFLGLELLGDVAGEDDTVDGLFTSADQLGGLLTAVMTP